MSGYACYPDESDSILVPEEVLKSLLGVSGVDLMSEAVEVADENGWTVKPASEGYWLFKRKSATGASPRAQLYSV